MAKNICFFSFLIILLHTFSSKAHAGAVFVYTGLATSITAHNQTAGITRDVAIYSSVIGALGVGSLLASIRLFRVGQKGFGAVLIVLDEEQNLNILEPKRLTLYLTLLEYSRMSDSDALYIAETAVESEENGVARFSHPEIDEENLDVLLK